MKKILFILLFLILSLNLFAYEGVIDGASQNAEVGWEIGNDVSFANIAFSSGQNQYVPLNSSTFEITNTNVSNGTITSDISGQNLFAFISIMYNSNATVELSFTRNSSLAQDISVDITAKKLKVENKALVEDGDKTISITDSNSDKTVYSHTGSYEYLKGGSRISISVSAPVNRFNYSVTQFDLGNLVAKITTEGGN